MSGIIHFEVFVLAGILLNLTPGQDTFFILGRSLAQGRKAGILSAMGISAGSIIHTLIACFGLSVLLAESSSAFMIVKVIGAAYLIFLGLKTLIKMPDVNLGDPMSLNRPKNGNIFVAGVLSNILNPKVALFYLAFLPQFIDPAYSNRFILFMILGLTFTITGTIWCVVLALLSSKLWYQLSHNSLIKVWFERISGIIFISLGIKLALEKG